MRKSKRNLWNLHYTILFLINILVSMTLYMTNTLMVGYLSGKGIAVVTAGSIVGIMSMASMCIRPFSGWIADRFSKKKLLLFFLGLYALVMLGYCLADSVFWYYGLRGLQGISFGIVTTATMAYVSNFIPDGRLGEGIGFFGLGQTIATAIGPFIGIQALRIWDEKAPFYGAVICLLISVFLIAFGLPEDQEEIRKPEKNWISLENFIAKEVLLYALITVAISAVNGIETSYIVSYATSLALGDVGWYFTISASVLFLARLFWGKLTDKYDFTYALYLGVVMIILALILLGGARHYSYVAVFGFAAVFKAVGVGILQPALQAACLKTVAPEKRGAASGTYYIGTDLGQGLSTIIAGHLISVCGYSGMYLCYIIPLVVVCILYAVIYTVKNRRRCKRIYEK